MGAIRSHTTGTTDAAWNAGDMVANMMNGQDESYYRSMFAWQDPEGDPATKSAYKFPHHMVNSDGDVGAANSRAASSGIGVLNGGRGGANIPDSDRKGVYNHLAKHIADAGRDAPDLSSRDDALERMYRAGVCEYKAYTFRELKTEGNGVFSGYASAYTRDLQNDRIAPGAFGQTIADKKGKVPILYNHDSDQLPLGFSTSLAEDGKGLMLSGQLATSTSAGADAYAMLKTAAEVGFRMGLSIGFVADDWEWNADDNSRLINSIDLWEVSLTPFPAQPKAYVADVKTFRDFERHLREAERFSRSDAKRILRLVSELNLPSRGTPDGAYERHSRILRAFAREPMEV
jgi:HK97 family phage prohead protease